MIMIIHIIFFIFKALVISYALYGSFLTGLWYSKGHIENGSWTQLLILFGWPYYRYYVGWSSKSDGDQMWDKIEKEWDKIKKEEKADI